MLKILLPYCLSIFFSLPNGIVLYESATFYSPIFLVFFSVDRYLADMISASVGTLVHRLSSGHVFFLPLDLGVELLGCMKTLF